MPASPPGSNRQLGYRLAKLVICGIFAGMTPRARLIAPPLLAFVTLGLGAASLAAQPAPPALKPPPDETIESPAPAKAKSATITLSADGQTVYVVGMLLEGAFHRFDAVLQTAPLARRVYLASAGGYTLEARLMASLTRKRRLDTYVEAYCASACTQMFAAGQTRVMGPAALLGFHQASLIDVRSGETLTRERSQRKLTATTVFGVNGNDTLRLAYEMIGTDPAFIDKALSHSHESMWLPSHQELIDAKMVTRVATRSEWPLPPGSGGSRGDLRSRLMESLLWRTALDKAPAAAEAAIDEVWRAYNSGSTFVEAAVAGRSKLVVFVTKAVAEAPDPLLDRSLTLYAESARFERARGYPGCKSALGIVPLPTGPEELRFSQLEDGLIIDVLVSSDRITRISGDQAAHYFSKEVVPLIAPLFSKSASTGQEGKCKLGLQMFETIDALPKKKRLKAYRALLSLPGVAAL